MCLRDNLQEVVTLDHGRISTQYGGHCVQNRIDLNLLLWIFDEHWGVDLETLQENVELHQHIPHHQPDCDKPPDVIVSFGIELQRHQ